MSSALIFPTATNDTYSYEHVWSYATKGTHSVYLYSSHSFMPWVPCASPLLPCYSLDLLGRQLLNQLLFYYFCSLFPPKSPPFSTSRLQLLCGFLCFFTSFSPLSILSLLPSPFPSSSPFPSPLLLSSPFPSCVRPRVSIPVPVPVHAPSPLSSPFLLAFIPATDPVCSLPSLGSGFHLCMMRVYRDLALRTELPGARKHHPLSAELVTRSEQRYLL